jgi:hypothetical protein
LSGEEMQNVSKDPILVYQMAKVGSRSVFFSLQLEYLRLGMGNVRIEHVHNLQNIDGLEQLARTASDADEQLKILGHYRAIRSEFDARDNQHWNAVTMIRDPVARHIGHFFHNIDRYLPDWERKWEGGRLSVDEVVQAILGIEDYGHAWIDNEILPVLGIDVYAREFPTEKGYQVYSNSPKVSLLVIRLEDLDRVAADAMTSFLGLKKFELYSANLGNEKPYAEVYRAVKAQPLPFSYVEKAYQTRFARHFYSATELRDFARKWTHA